MATILESKDDFQNTILSDNERRLIYKVRVMLLDLPDDVFRSLNTLIESQRGERTTDQILLNYLQLSIGYMNSIPLQSSYTLSTFPSAWETLVVLGAVVFALFAQSVFQAGESFSYSDNGLSLNLSDMSSRYGQLSNDLKNSWQQSVADMKRYENRSVGPAGITGGGISGNMRIRSYAPRMWTYR